MLDRITPVVLTYNEEANIGRSLDHLWWAAEVVIVDSFSSDRTREIATAYPNVRLVQRQFDDHASQWNFALTQVRSEWVLALDADYVIPSALIDEIRALTPPPSVAAYEARFRYFVDGRPLRGAFYTPKPVLIRTAATRFVQDGHTQRPVISGDVPRLQTPIGHDDRKPLREFVKRQRRYMKLEAAKIRSTPFKTLSASGKIRKLIVVAPPGAFLYALFGRGAILDGRRGLHYAFERFIAESILSAELVLPRGTVRILRGPHRGLKWIASAGVQSYWLGGYEPRTQKAFAASIPPGATVFDVGANVGFYTLLAAVLVGPRGRVVAFEPLPQNLEYLQRHLAMNRISNVTVVEAALSDAVGESRFRTAPHPAMGAVAAEGELSVRVTTIDQARQDVGAEPPRVIKIDVEGGEYQVLLGARETLARGRPVLLLSTHGYANHTRCSDLLRALGYELELLRDGTADGNYEILARTPTPAESP